MIKKVIEGILPLSLLLMLLFAFVQVVIESYSYEEVDTYINNEEAKILQTGTIESFSSYGINRGHSTTQDLQLVDYLKNYIAINVEEGELEDCIHIRLSLIACLKR